MSKLLVTGGAGFIGSAFIRLSLAADRSVHVVNLDKRSEEHTSELQSPCNLACRLLFENKPAGLKSEDYPILLFGGHAGEYGAVLRLVGHRRIVHRIFFVSDDNPGCIHPSLAGYFPG